MNICATLWKSYDELKQGHADAEMFLNKGKNLSHSDYQNAIEKLTKAKEDYNNSLYTNLPDGRKIYALDYLYLKRIADENNIEASEILNKQNEKLLDNNYRINSLKLNFLGLMKLDVSGFSNLTELDCSSNQLTSLDVTKNTALTELHCYENQLTSLDMTKNSALIELECYNNQLISLDVSNNFALQRLKCSINKLLSLDVTHNTALVWLDCSSNQLTSLEVPKNSALLSLECSFNQLTSLLSLKNLPHSTWVYASDNSLDNAAQKLAIEKGWQI